MKLRDCLAVLATVFAIWTFQSADAATVTVTIDRVTTDVPTFTIPDTPENEPDGGKIAIGTLENPGFVLNSDSGVLTLAPGLLDPDPSIIFAGAFTDTGAPSTFGLTIILPLVPQVTNPSYVFDSLSRNLTNGPSAGNVTLTAEPPPAGVPVDVDGVTEMQVFTLSDDNGATWKNVGLDAGPTATVFMGANASAVLPGINQGFIPTIAGGPWTHMRADLSFSLPGGGVKLGFVGAKVLVPEPGSLLLALLALGASCACARRTQR